MKIAITTPTGHIGSKLVQNLLRKGPELVLLARRPEKLKEAEANGARVIPGDLKDEAYYKSATVGVDVLFHVAPPDVTSPNIRAEYNQLAKNGATAVQANKIKRVVHLSSVGADKTEKTGPVLGLHDAEEIFNQTGAQVTHLRPAYFFENFFSSVPAIQQSGRIFLAIPGSAKTAMVATRDIADVGAKVILNQSGSKKIVYILGTKEYSFDEVASELGKFLSKEVKVQTIGREELINAMAKFGVSRNFAEGIVELYEGFVSGYIKSTEPRDRENTTPTTLEQFIKEELGPVLKTPAAVYSQTGIN